MGCGWMFWVLVSFAGIPGTSSCLGSCQGLIVCQGLLLEFMLAKPAACHSSVCHPKKAEQDKRWCTCITVSGNCLLFCFGGSKDHTPVKRGVTLLCKPAEEGKLWLRALCAICPSLLVECGCCLWQLLVKIQMDRSYLGQEACKSHAVPFLCQLLLAAHCACHWDSTCVSHRKCRYQLRSSSLCLEFGSTSFQLHYPKRLRHRWEFRDFVVSYPLLKCLSYKIFTTVCCFVLNVLDKCPLIFLLSGIFF